MILKDPRAMKGSTGLLLVVAYIICSFVVLGEASSRQQRDATIKNICKTKVPASEPLGKGAYGTAYLVPIEDGNPAAGLAVLKVPKTGHKKALREEIMNYLRAGDHPNIPKLLGSCNNPRAPLLLMEYVDGLPMSKWLETNFPDGAAPPVETQYKILRQLAEVLYWIERRKMVHSDAHGANIIVQGSVAEPTLKLIDFGVAVDRTSRKAAKSKLVLHEDVDRFCARAWILAQGSENYVNEEQDEAQALRLEKEVYKNSAALEGPSNPKWIPQLLRMCLKAVSHKERNVKKMETSMRRFVKFLGGLSPSKQ